MSDYISREALITAVEGNPYVTDSVKSYVRCTARSIPSADFHPVVKGKWIEYTRVVVPEPYNKWEQAWKCDKCGFDDGFPAYNFCPNCGADMREEIDHA